MVNRLRRIEQFLLRNPTRRLTGYGVVVGVVGVLGLATQAPSHWDMMPGRRAAIHASVLALDDGKPPLTARISGGSGEPKTYGATEQADDPGIFLFASLLGHAIGNSDPITLHRILFLALFAVPLVVYPVVFWRLFASVPAALFAPLGLLFGVAALVRFQPNLDIYWIQAWAILALLAPLLAIDIGWRRDDVRGVRPFLLMVLLAVGASFASSIRLHTGLPVLIAALISLATGPRWRPRAKIGAAAILIVAYMSVTPIAIGALRSYRDDHVRIASSTGQLGSHVFWHNAFIGLGYLPNPYGLRYSDRIGDIAAKKESPTVVYASKRYEQIIRKKYFRFLRDHPGFVIGLTLKKVVVALAWAAPMLLLLTITLPRLLVSGEEQAQMRRFLLLLSPALALLLLPPLLTTPDLIYTLGWLGAVALLSLLVVASLLTSLSRRAAPLPGIRAFLRSLGNREAVTRILRQRRVQAGFAIGGVLAVIVISAVALDLRRQVTRWTEEPQPTPAQVRV